MGNRDGSRPAPPYLSCKILGNQGPASFSLILDFMKSSHSNIGFSSYRSSTNSQLFLSNIQSYVYVLFWKVRQGVCMAYILLMTYIIDLTYQLFLSLFSLVGNMSCIKKWGVFGKKTYFFYYSKVAQIFCTVCSKLFLFASC